MGRSKDSQESLALELAGGYEKGMMNIPFWQANSESPATPPGDMSTVVEDAEGEVKAVDTLWSTEGTVDLVGLHRGREE